MLDLAEQILLAEGDGQALRDKAAGHVSSEKLATAIAIQSLRESTAEGRAACIAIFRSCIKDLPHPLALVICTYAAAVAGVDSELSLGFLNAAPPPDRFSKIESWYLQKSALYLADLLARKNLPDEVGTAVKPVQEQLISAIVLEKDFSPAFELMIGLNRGNNPVAAKDLLDRVFQEFGDELRPHQLEKACQYAFHLFTRLAEEATGEPVSVVPDLYKKYMNKLAENNPRECYDIILRNSPGVLSCRLATYRLAYDILQRYPDRFKPRNKADLIENIMMIIKIPTSQQESQPLSPQSHEYKALQQVGGMLIANPEVAGEFHDYTPSNVADFLMMLAANKIVSAEILERIAAAAFGCFTPTEQYTILASLRNAPNCPPEIKTLTDKLEPGVLAQCESDPAQVIAVAFTNLAYPCDAAERDSLQDSMVELLDLGVKPEQIPVQSAMEQKRRNQAIIGIMQTRSLTASQQQNFAALYIFNCDKHHSISTFNEIGIDLETLSGNPNSDFCTALHHYRESVRAAAQAQSTWLAKIRERTFPMATVPQADPGALKQELRQLRKRAKREWKVKHLRRESEIFYQLIRATWPNQYHYICPPFLQIDPWYSKYHNHNPGLECAYNHGGREIGASASMLSFWPKTDVPEADKDPTMAGWKLHIQVDRPHIEIATDALLPVLARYGLNDFKIWTVKPDAPDNQSQKVFTLYIDHGRKHNAAEWPGILADIETTLRRAHVRICRPIRGDRQLTGSRFIFYRNAKNEKGDYIYAPVEGRVGATAYNPSGAPDIFADIDIGPLISPDPAISLAARSRAGM